MATEEWQGVKIWVDKHECAIRYLTIPEAARQAGYRTRTAIYGAIKTGRIPEGDLRRVGPKMWLITEEGLQRYLDGLSSKGVKRGGRRPVVNT